MTPDDAKRVLHAVVKLDPGGVETWLLQVLGEIDRERFQIDVLVLSADEGAYDDEVRALGGEVLPCLQWNRPWVFARNFKRLMAEHGPYDIVHSHGYRTSGLLAYLAHGAGIPVRIVHARSGLYRGDERSLTSRGLKWLIRHLVSRYATDILAISDLSAVALLGPRLLSDPRYRRLTTGIDLAPFATSVDRQQLRAGLSIPGDAVVVSCVGRFIALKNHRFFVEIAAVLARRRPDLYFMLVGDGPERSGIEARVAELGLAERFVFTGVRPDVAALMKAAMDVLVFPSKSEGLGRVVVEAQAAGLPCVISDIVPDEVDVISDLTSRMSLAAPALAWADKILERVEDGPTVSQPEALEIVRQSPFDIGQNVRALEDIYSSALTRRSAVEQAP